MSRSSAWRCTVAALLGILALCPGRSSLASEAAPTTRPSNPNIPGLLFSESFDDPGLAARGWYDGTKWTITPQGTLQGPGCIEFHWNDRSSTPMGAPGIRHLFTPSDVVYLRFYIKLDPKWGWSGKNWHPHLTHFVTTENDPNCGPAATHLTVYVEPVNGKLRLSTQDIQNKNAPHGLTQGPLRGGYNEQIWDSEEVLFKDDQWHCVEGMFKLNSVDVATGKWNADGEARGWFDGKLVIERTGVIFRSVDFPNMKFNQFLLAPYFGPGLLPHAQTLWIDELTVSTQRIGPLSK